MTRECMHAIILLEVRKIKNITLRVSEDFHYSVKTYATKEGKSLQSYMIDVVTDDLKAHNAYISSPITELVDSLTDKEVAEMVKLIKERKQNK
ncbi:MAG: hypothetical protein NC253_16025 [Ruminococcus sp.]|nr:hypothetical protein [Ruminococcus sp.]MCM1382788.1 hypothetical protein [Muribaculaceae bacterium]MCM1480882.1 hypothetical protein [Muribaculaceae bacterium]